MYSSVRYVRTYCPAVQAAYHADMESDYMYVHTDSTSIDDWIADKGRYVFRDRPDLPEKLRIELRPLWGRNTGARVFVLPRCDAESFEELLQSLGADDVVSVDGYSVVNATRQDIAQKGPEFYVVPREGDFPAELPVDTEYLVSKERLLEAFVDTALGIARGVVAKAAAKLETRDHVRAFYTNLKKIVEVGLRAGLQTTEVADERTSKTYGQKAFEAMLHSTCPQHRRRTRKGDFTVLLRQRMGEMIGAQVHAWAHEDLPAFWPSVESDVEEVKEARLKAHIGASVSSQKKGRRSAYGNLLLLLGDENRSVRKRRRKRGADGVAESIGTSIFSDMHRTCDRCREYGCEDGKSGQRLGMLLQFSNASERCPQSQFDARMKVDAGLRKCVKRLSSRIGSRDVPDGVHQVFVCPAREMFAAEDNLFSMKQIRASQKVAGLTGALLKNRGGETRYSLVGSSLVSVAGKRPYVEHRDERLPHSLILLEVV